MIAYFVHDDDKDHDLLVLPEMGCQVAVNAAIMEKFIAVNPEFATLSGDACGDVKPEDFGTVVATREEGGDVCILNPELWRRRMEHYMGAP